MKVFWSAKHGLHTPGWYVADGRVRDCPEVPGRVEAILRAVGGMKAAEVVEVGGGAADIWAAVRRVHDEGYLEYLRTIHGVWWAEFGCEVLPDTFVRRVGGAGMRRPGKLSAQAGYYCFDIAAPILAGTWEAAVGSAGCAVSAAEAVLRGERAAYALCRPPGHHAGRDYCGGFCYLNNAAIAAERLLLEGKKRVAVLDVDYHHGNGTQDIFYGRGDVMFVSVHADPDTQYPYFWGYAEEMGVGEGVGTTVNLPLARGVGEAAWLAALEFGLGRIEAFGAEAVVVSLGVDVMEGDEVGDFRVGVKGLMEAGRRIGAAVQGRGTVFVQEGGYTLGKVGECVGAVLGGFEGGQG